MIDSGLMITLLQLSQGITFGVFWLLALQMVVRLTPDHLRSTGQGVLASVCFGVGGIIGGMAGGWMLEAIGPYGMFLSMAGMTFIAAVIIFVSQWVLQRNQTGSVEKKF